MTVTGAEELLKATPRIVFWATHRYWVLLTKSSETMKDRLNFSWGGNIISGVLFVDENGLTVLDCIRSQVTLGEGWPLAVQEITN